MNPILRTFYLNENEREAVKAFLIATLGEMAVEKAFAGESINGIKDARDLIDKAFDNLKAAYDKVKSAELPNSR